MNETKRLEMLVKHYEDKEKNLIEFIEFEKNKANTIIENTENHTLKVKWGAYKSALKLVLEQIEKLERVK